MKYVSKGILARTIANRHFNIEAGLEKLPSLIENQDRVGLVTLSRNMFRWNPNPLIPLFRVLYKSSRKQEDRLNTASLLDLKSKINRIWAKFKTTKGYKKR